MSIFSNEFFYIDFLNFIPLICALFLKTRFVGVSSVKEGLLDPHFRKYFSENTMFPNKIYYTAKKVFSSEETIFFCEGLKILQSK